MAEFLDVQQRVNTLLDKISENCRNSMSVEGFLQTGESKLSHDVVSETMYLDAVWIETIDQALFSIEQIVKDPKKSIIDEQILVNVAKAKKFNAKSIQYLSSHTQHIASIEPNGDVRPNKVMTTQMEEDYKTYENRFVYTLIDKLEKFVRARFDDITSKFNLHKTDVIELDNQVKYRGAEIKCNVRLMVRDTPRGSVELEKNRALLQRIEVILKRIRIMKASNFWLKLDGTKAVLPPIIKTNVITKNVDYSNAYQLWLYISSYTFEGFRVEVERKALPFDQEYFEDLTAVAALFWNVTDANNHIRKDLFDKVPVTECKKKKYRVLTKFNYDPTFGRSSEKVSENLINQYYFDEMKRIIGKGTQSLRGESIVRTKNLSLPFARFYRSLTKISNEIYADVLKVEPTKSTKKKKTQLDLLKSRIKMQQEVLRRAKILSKLKAQELTRTLNLESRELVKLEKLRFDLALLEEKKTDQKVAQAKKKSKIKAIKQKQETALENAQEARQLLLEQETERQERLQEEKREKFRKIQETRERKTLARLKEKYENADE